MNLFPNLHETFAKLHGGMRRTPRLPSERSDEIKAAYAEYAAATSHANEILQKHGPASPQFVSADVASMRLFHRVKKLQGLKKSRSD